MTQGNTPPGRILEARLLHINKRVGPNKGSVGKISSTSLLRTEADTGVERKFNITGGLPLNTLAPAAELQPQCLSPPPPPPIGSSFSVC